LFTSRTDGVSRSGAARCARTWQVYQPGRVEVFESGVLSPLRIEARIPGIDRRASVSLIADDALRFFNTISPAPG
jgi:hypothetical protein